MTNRQLFLSYLAQTSDAPLMLEVERAEGVHIYDPNGKAYIDLISGIGVSNVGHRHPAVVRAIKEQTDQYLHTMVYGEFVQSPQVKLAEALTSTLPDPLSSVYLMNSGSEAIEGALKLAKRATGRPEIITFKNAYHGSSHGALSASGDDFFKRNFRPLVPGFKHLDYNDISQLEHITNKTAGVLLEVVQGEAGVIAGTQEFIQALRKKCDEVGALLMFDEIQTGFGRTGKFWAFQHHSVKPDILVSAKGMGGGMPIGCFISSKELMSVFVDNPVLGHISTFGGHPVSCAASLACLNIIQDEKLYEEAEEKAELIKSLLDHHFFSEIRNKGLMMAAVMDSYEVLKPTIDRAIEKGVITDWFLFNDRSMRIAPPLTITEDEIRKACEIVLEALED